MKYDLTCLVDEGEEGMTAKGVLRRKKGVSLRLIRRITHEGGAVHLNGELARFIDCVKAGDVIGLVFPSESNHLIPQNIPLAALYEDDDLLAIDKQPGIVVHPTKGHPDGTIANGIIHRMEERGDSFKVRFINRLDMDTSGVLLIGKNIHAQSDFAAQAKRGLVEKRYIAIVEGIVKESAGSIDLPIALEDVGERRGEGDILPIPKRIVRADGNPSVTHYRVLERFDRGFTLLELKLETGRTHQIRVHMAHMGHPVVGDSLYGNGRGLMDRQALHAQSLRFRHPSQDREIYIEAPLPEDMQRCVETL
jgi:23S rRNA pseudouridine1911/1915/1917 synthase